MGDSKYSIQRAELARRLAVFAKPPLCIRTCELLQYIQINTLRAWHIGCLGVGGVGSARPDGGRK